MGGDVAVAPSPATSMTAATQLRLVPSVHEGVASSELAPQPMSFSPKALSKNSANSSVWLALGTGAARLAPVHTRHPTKSSGSDEEVVATVALAVEPVPELVPMACSGVV